MKVTFELLSTLIRFSVKAPLHYTKPERKTEQYE